MIVECGHVGAFDRAKLRSPTQNCPVHYTYSTSEDKCPSLEIFLLYIFTAAFKEKQRSYWVLVPLDPTGSPRLGYAQRCPHSLNTAQRRDWNDGCERCPARAALVGFLYRNWGVVNATGNLMQGTFTKNFSPVCDGWALTLGSTLCPMRLTKRVKTFSTKTLIAALCVLALLRTCAIHLTLIHICFQKQKKWAKMRKTWVDYRKVLLVELLDQDLYLHRCVFLSFWACSRACMNKVSLPPLGRYSCVHRYCHCTCAHCLGLTGGNTKIYRMLD